MPTATVNGTTIAYEVFGRGPLLVWTEGGRFGRNALSYLWAGHFSQQYSVLIWDKRNAAGASDVSLSGDPWHVSDAEDLHALLDKLALGPACLAGGSAGCYVSLLVARHYPEDVKALILLQPGTDDDDPALATPWAEPFVRLAEAAEEGGMQRAVDASTEAWDRQRRGEHPEAATWLAETIHKNPSNRDRTISMDPEHFSRFLRRWGELIVSTRWPPFLTEDEVRMIPFPAMVVPGRDEVHPRRSAERLAKLLRGAVLADYPEEVNEAVPVFEGICMMFPAMDGFLARAHPSDR